jgi:WD40-like Beta Propeller Repeat
MKFTHFLWTFWLVLGLLSVGCGEGSSSSPPPPPNIVLQSIVPTYVTAGSGNTTLSINGTGFTSSSVAYWDHTALSTSFGSSVNMQATIPASLLAQPGAAQITVKDSSVTSNVLSFDVASPAAVAAGVIALVTAAPDGSPANGDTGSGNTPAISVTGRYVAFQSLATNLALGTNTSGFAEIFERDTCIGAPSGCTPSTWRITVTSDGSPVNGHSFHAAVSADGRYVAFDTAATNILPNTSQCSPSQLFGCVFLRDTCTGAPLGCVPSTTIISVAPSGAAGGGNPAITTNSRFITFNSTGTSPGVSNVYIWDSCNGAPPGCVPGATLVSAASDGSPGNQNSTPSAVSASGRFVAFASSATNLTSVSTGGYKHVYWRDTCIGAASGCTPNTVMVDVTNSGSPANQSFDSFGDNVPPISADGRIVAFSTNGTNLVSQNVQGFGNTYVHDTCNGAPSGCTPSTSLASLANDGSIANQGSNNEAMSADGRFVAFASLASNLVPGDTFAPAAWKDIFVRDTCYNAPTGCIPNTVRVSVTNTPNPQTESNAISDYPAISADGHYIVFISAATNFLPGVTGNGHAMVYLAKTGF